MSELTLIEHDLGDHDHAYIIPISDTHIGDPRFDEAKLRGYIEWVTSRPNAWVVLNGDLLDCATLSSVGDTYDATMSPNDQLRFAREIFEPLRGRILGVTEGNHERRIRRDSGIDVAEILAIHLGAPYQREVLAMSLRLGKGANGKRIVYTMVATHGTGGGRTPGGKAGALERLGGIGLFDVYTIGHIHNMLTYQRIYYVPDLQNRGILERKLTFVSSGSYVGWGGYAAAGMFQPAKLGSPRIRLGGRDRDCHVSI